MEIRHVLFSNISSKSNVQMFYFDQSKDIQKGVPEY